MERTHASFFSGVGGLDIGLERAGWRTVSFSEIDPYASAVLAERWPGVPNLGDITDLAGVLRQHEEVRRTTRREHKPHHPRRPEEPDGRDDWRTATLWTGGFPCQDLSVAGKRAGMGSHAVRADTRSGLAYAFLDLVERHHPPAILMENVPGLLSSHAGRDLGALLGRLGQLGYGWAYRVLDAQWFGVPQRRRRVFILAINLGLDPSGFGPAEVLAVGTRCGRDHASEREAWARAAGRAGRNVVGALPAGTHGFPDGVQEFMQGHFIVGAPPDADRVRAPDGLAGRLDGGEVVGAIQPGAKGWRGMMGDGADPIVFVKGKRAQTTEDDETWRADAVSPTLNAFDVGDTRATTLVADTGIVTALSQGLGSGGPDAAHAQAGWLTPLGGTVGPSPDPGGLDSNRYRVVGNGVVAPVAEWIGWRLADYFDGAL